MESTGTERDGEPGGATAPVEWGCAAFREVIGFMRERWPEIAKDAEHPMLEALLAADGTGDKRRRKQLRPICWIKTETKPYFKDVLATPMTLRQMMAIEAGYAAYDSLYHRPGGNLSFALYIVGGLQAGICSFFLTLSFIQPLLIRSIAFTPFYIWAVCGGLALIFGAILNRVSMYKLIQERCDRFLFKMQRKYDKQASTDRKVAMAYLLIPFLAMLSLTWWIFVIASPLIGIGVSLASTRRINPDPWKKDFYYWMNAADRLSEDLYVTGIGMEIQYK